MSYIKLCKVFWTIVLVLSFSCQTQASSTNNILTPFIKSQSNNSILAAVQEAKLIVSEVFTNDRFGNAVGISGDYAIIGVSDDDFMGSSSGTAYIYKYDGSSWVQFQRLVASDAKSGDRFGFSVSISGTRAIVGAKFAPSNQGQVYVYDFDGVSWLESHILTTPVDVVGSNNVSFGSSVSLFGDRLLIGASGDSEFIGSSGAAYIFDYNNGTNTWSQTKRLKVQNANQAYVAGGYGTSVSLFGNTAMIGVPGDDEKGDRSGAVYVYEYNMATSMWIEQQKLFASDFAERDNFGFSLSSYSNHLVVGSWFDTNSNGTNAGSAYFFEYNGVSNNWEFRNKLLAPGGLSGDFFGYSVAMSNNRIAVGAYQYDEIGVVNNLGTAYIFEFNGADAYNHVQRIIPEDGGNFNKAFGISVALDKDNMTPNNVLIGAYGDEEMAVGAGSAYVFDYDTVNWSQTQKFIAGDGVLNDKFGQVVSISGETAVVGAYSDQDMGVNAGAVYVFDYVDSNWVFSQKLFADDAQEGDFFGFAVSIENDRLVIGAQGDDDKGVFSGSVYVFEHDGLSWIQQHKLLASDGLAGDSFGVDVAVSGNRILIGALHDDNNGGNDAGSAYIFNYDTLNNQWNEVTPKLTASDGSTDDNFAISVALDGDNALIGAWANDDVIQGDRAGSAYIFNYDGSSWNQLTKLLPADIDTDDFFGMEVDIQGQWAVIGANNDDEAGSKNGSAYVYQYNAGTMTWVESQKLTAGLDAGHFDNFGREISIDGNKLLISSFANDDVGNNSGSVYVYDYNGVWFESQKLTASDAADSDFFGISVAMSGNRALIGAVGDDNNWIDDGAAYIVNVATRYDLKINVAGFFSQTASSKVTFVNGNDALSVTADGTQILSNLADTTAYDISITQQPHLPIQDCEFDDPNSGNILGSDATVNVTCTTKQYELSVRVFGLAAGNSIEVTNNLGDNFVLDTNSEIKIFPTKIDHRATYTVDLVSPQPTTPNQTCITHSGTMFADVLSNVFCTTNQYSVGGTVSGLVMGNELVLQNNNGDDLILTQDGSFSFDTLLDDESDYTVSILKQPRNPHQTCTLSNQQNQLAGSNVDTVLVNCVVSPDLIYTNGFEETP